MTSNELELTDKEKELTKQWNGNVFEVLLKCCKNGYYISKGGHYCYPIIYSDYGMKCKAFACVGDTNKKYANEEAIVRFRENGELDGAEFRIDNSLLPKEIKDYGEDTKITEFENGKGNILYAEVNGKKYATGRFSESFGGGYSEGKKESITNLFKTIGFGMKINSVVDVTDCNFLENLHQINKNGALLDETGKPADPRYKDCIVLNGEVSKRFPKGYKCSEGEKLKKVGLFNKSDLTKKLLQKEQVSFTAFGKLKFSTQNGFEIYDIDAVYDSDGGFMEKKIEKRKNSHSLSEVKKTVSDRKSSNLENVLKQVEKNSKEKENEHEEQR